MLYWISTLLLGPFLLLQGKYVRATAELLPEAEGERKGTSGNGPALELLIVGDSAGAGVGVESQSQALLGQLVSQLSDDYSVKFQLEANSGDNSLDCLKKLQHVDAAPVDIVVTSLGVNDVTSGASARLFTTRICRLVEYLRSDYLAKHIILSGLPPMGHFPALPQPLRWYLGLRAQRFDRALKQLSKEIEVGYIAFEYEGDISGVASDGFHPGADVYTQWATLVAAHIKQAQIG